MASGDVQVDLQQILIGKYFFLGAYTMLLYDHLATFPDEIQAVWKKKKTRVLYLFLFVRYYALCAVTVCAFGFFSTLMNRERCARWMLFLPLGTVMPLTLIPGTLMLIRLYALYNRNRILLYALGALLGTQTAVGLWQFTLAGGTPAPLPLDNYQFHFCIYLPPKRIGRLSTLFVFMELGYDTLVFLLTMARTTYVYWEHHKRGLHPGSSLLSNLIRDGALYFGAIFSMNLTWVLMIMYAPTNLRAIASIPSSCVTTTVICRITLNLRMTVYGPAKLDERTLNIPLSDLRPPGASRRARSRRNRLGFGEGSGSGLGEGVQVQVERSYGFEEEEEEGEVEVDGVVVVSRKNVEMDLVGEGEGEGEVESVGHGYDSDLPFSNGNGFGRDNGHVIRWGRDVYPM